MVEARASKDAVIREAADWLARLDAAAGDPSLRAAFAAWRAEDPAHVIALARLGYAWEAAAPAPAAISSRAPATRRSRVWRIGLAAAGLAAAASVALALLPPGVSYATAIGERRRVVLPDGVVLELNTGTRVRLTGRGARRALRLDRGEVLITRPAGAPALRLVAGEVQLPSPEGAFDLRLRGHAAELAVLEGAVRLGAVQALPGDYATLTGDLAGARIERAQGEVQRRLAWRRDLLDFNGQTLAEAAAEFNRYNTLQITVDAGAADLRIGGVFSTREPRAFAAATARAFGLRVKADDQGLRLSATPG